MKYVFKKKKKQTNKQTTTTTTTTTKTTRGTGNYFALDVNATLVPGSNELSNVELESFDKCVDV